MRHCKYSGGDEKVYHDILEIDGRAKNINEGWDSIASVGRVYINKALNYDSYVSCLGIHEAEFLGTHLAIKVFYMVNLGSHFDVIDIEMRSNESNVQKFEAYQYYVKSYESVNMDFIKCRCDFYDKKNGTCKLPDNFTASECYLLNKSDITSSGKLKVDSTEVRQMKEKMRLENDAIRQGNIERQKYYEERSEMRHREEMEERERESDFNARLEDYRRKNRHLYRD